MPKFLHFKILLVCLVLHVFAKSQPIINIVKLGAVGDGTTLNTLIIQKAVDSATKIKGGAIVQVPAGTFLTGGINLKSNVELRIEQNGMLLGSTNFFDYTKNRWYALVYAKNQKNISITGQGIMDGQGTILANNIDTLIQKGTLTDPNYATKHRPDESLRPQLIEFISCSTVKVHKITLKNSSCWVEAYNKCTNLTIDSITVNSTAYWNNDGMDITDCNTVTIANNYINSADDGICLKSSDSLSFCQNVTVTNCTVRSSATAFKLGSPSVGGFKNIIVNGLTVFDTYRTAIGLEMVDGGLMDGVNISNVKATTTDGALFIRLGFRNSAVLPGIIRNITIKNVSVDVPLTKPDAGYPYEGPNVPGNHNAFPSSITGLAGYPAQGITLDNIQVNSSGGGDSTIAKITLDNLGNVPEKELVYPEFSMFGELPAWGLYARHAKGLTIKNCKFSYKQNDFRPAIVLDDVSSYNFSSDSITSYQKTPIVFQHDVLNDTLNIVLPGGVDAASGIVKSNQFLASQPFTPNNLVVLRVGDLGTALQGVSTYANLLELNPATAKFTGVNVSLNNKIPGSRLTLGGAAAYEGGINLTQDGRYITVVGYDQPLGLQYSNTNATSYDGAWNYTKVIGRVPYTGVVDYATKITISKGYNNSGIRCVASYDGSQFWVTGASTGTAGQGFGTQYVPYGDSVPVNITNSVYRYISLFKKQLYTGGVNIFKAPLPTTTTGASAVPGAATTGSSPYAFVFLDTDSTISYKDGYDLLYAADVNNGIYKYYYNGTTWVQSGLYSITGGVTGLTARLNAQNQPEVFAIKGSSANNSIISFTDTNPTNSTTNFSPKTLATAGSNFLFKSVAFTPVAQSVLPLGLLDFTASYNNQEVTLQWGTTNEINMDRFAVERSTDGNSFTSITALHAKNNLIQNDYSTSDASLFTGTVYYRLKMVGKDGSFSYSKIVAVPLPTYNSQLSIFPNPAKNTITVSHPGFTKAAQLNILSADGKCLSSLLIQPGKTSTLLNVASLTSGTYTIVVKTQDKTLINMFIKLPN
ncbi:glycosyl hydrolase family 28 protein [Parasediminibacterium sp. JCM 36343]|uniref:glycosyl hydrolase family 28 protein n=1 Tax=Parasediminibacterium sp. JCM 36343 TaxID=3374279 RepID=UPI003978CC3C